MEGPASAALRRQGSLAGGLRRGKRADTRPQADERRRSQDCSHRQFASDPTLAASHRNGPRLRPSHRGRRARTHTRALAPIRALCQRGCGRMPNRAPAWRSEPRPARSPSAVGVAEQCWGKPTGTLRHRARWQCGGCACAGLCYSHAWHAVRHVATVLCPVACAAHVCDALSQWYRTASGGTDDAQAVRQAATVPCPATATMH